MGLEGSLREFPVSDIIQMVSLSKQTGSALINTTYRGRNSSGNIYFKNGSVVNAEFENFPPMEALLTFFTLEEGNFVFNPGEPISQEVISSSNTMIVMQGIERQDEVKAVRAILPNPRVVPLLEETINITGNGDLNLKPDDWRLLFFINGQDDLTSLSLSSGLSQFQTEKSITNLLNLGLVVLKEKNSAEVLQEVMRSNLQYELYATLSDLAASLLGNSSRNLIEQSYQRSGVTIESEVSLEQALDIVANFQKLARLLVGPRRSEAVSDQMRERTHKLYQDS